MSNSIGNFKQVNFDLEKREYSIIVFNGENKLTLKLILPENNRDINGVFNDIELEELLEASFPIDIAELFRLLERTLYLSYVAFPEINLTIEKITEETEPKVINHIQLRNGELVQLIANSKVETNELPALISYITMGPQIRLIKTIKAIIEEKSVDGWQNVVFVVKYTDKKKGG